MMLWATMWVVGMEPRSSKGAASAVNGWPFSSPQQWLANCPLTSAHGLGPIIGTDSWKLSNVSMRNGALKPDDDHSTPENGIVKRNVTDKRGSSSQKLNPIQNFNDSSFILITLVFLSKIYLIRQLLKVKKVSLNACWPKIAMLHTLKGLILCRTIRCRILLNGDQDTIWWTYSAPVQVKQGWPAQPRGRMVVMWALPMTSWQKM